MTEQLTHTHSKSLGGPGRWGQKAHVWVVSQRALDGESREVTASYRVIVAQNLPPCKTCLWLWPQRCDLVSPPWLCGPGVGLLPPWITAPAWPVVLSAWGWSPAPGSTAAGDSTLLGEARLEPNRSQTPKQFAPSKAPCAGPLMCPEKASSPYCVLQRSACYIFTVPAHSKQTRYRPFSSFKAVLFPFHRQGD